MATITLRLDEQTREAVDALARGRGLTVSELLRGTIDGMLGRDVPDPSHAPTTLTMVERRILASQHETMAKLHADDEHETGYHQRMVEVLNEGYTAEYADVFIPIRPELSPRQCTFVHDVLDMFWKLKISLDRLAEEERAALGKQAEQILAFRGFDFNDSLEGRLAAYARHLIESDRWAELADRFDDKHERGNSHMPMLATYRRMLDAFGPVWEARIEDNSLPHDERYILSTDDLRKVMDAWPYPRD